MPSVTRIPQRKRVRSKRQKNLADESMRKLRDADGVGLCFAKTPASFGINDIAAVLSTSVLV
jgi:hypothetical protein